MQATKAIRILFFIFLFVSNTSTAHSTNALEEMWGMAVDPLKLRQASTELADSAERSLNQIDEIRAKTNEDVKQRLEQVRSILHEALSGSQQLVDRAAERMLELERKIYSDAEKLIARVECAAEVVASDRLQRAFGELMANIRRTKPGFRFFGARVLTLDAREFEITNRDTLYWETKKETLDQLADRTRAESAAYSILSAYQNLAIAARFTRCHYPGASSIIFTQEVNEFERRSLPWVLTVRIATP